MTWQLESDGIAYLMEARRRLDSGLPAAFPDDPDRPVTAAVLANREITLDLIDHPLVLNFFCLQDPVEAVALAAASRLMPVAAGSRIGRQTAAWIAEAAPHGGVRDAVGDVVVSGFSAHSLEALAWLTRRRRDDDAREARQRMLALLKSLTRPDVDGTGLPARLVNLSSRIGMHRGTFEHLVMALVEGRHVTTEAKTALIEGLDALPRPLRYRVMASICALPADMRTAPMKRALAARLVEPETGPPTPETMAGPAETRPGHASPGAPPRWSWSTAGPKAGVAAAPRVDRQTPPSPPRPDRRDVLAPPAQPLAPPVLAWSEALGRAPRPPAASRLRRDPADLAAAF